MNSKLMGPVLVTGLPGQVGGVGRAVVELLRQRGLPVRALVLHDDGRADEIRATGTEVVIGDLTNGSDVVRALADCRRMYFGMSVSAAYLEATVIAAAAGREHGGLDVFVNISQMTVSQMSLTEMTGSPQHQQHLLAELVLNWSGLPVVHVRPTVFLENPHHPQTNNRQAICKRMRVVVSRAATSARIPFRRVFGICREFGIFAA